MRSGDETVPEYVWQLLDDSGEEVASGTVGETEMETREFRDKKFLYIPVEEQPDSKGKQYTFVLKADGATQNGCLSAYMAEGNEYAGNLAVNGENSENALVLKVIAKGFNAETFLVFLGLVVYVGLFVKFMYKLFR